MNFKRGGGVDGGDGRLLLQSLELGEPSVLRERKGDVCDFDFLICMEWCVSFGVALRLLYIEAR